MFNINNIVQQSQSFLYPLQELTFTNTNVSWSLESREPTETTTSITIKGRLQPLDPATYQQLNFNINDYEYYRVYISNITPTQADQIRQLGTSEFIYNNLKYRIVGKLPYDTNGWRELYCYLINQEEQNNE